MHASTKGAFFAKVADASRSRRRRQIKRPLNPEMLAERWSCSAETVRQMFHRGDLRGFRVGRMIRIPWDAVEEVEGRSISKPHNDAATSTDYGKRDE